MSESVTPAQCTDAEWRAAAEAGLPYETPGTNAFDAALHRYTERMQQIAYAEGRKDEREQWERVGFIGLDAAQRLAAANLGTTTTITKEAPFDDDVALWRRRQ